MARSEKLAHDTADRLQKLILSNNYASGDKLPSENLLAEELNVSRNTIRKSLQFLEAEGLVAIVKNRGAIVSHITSDKQITLFPFISATPQSSQLFHEIFGGVQEYFKEKNCAALLSAIGSAPEEERNVVLDFISKGYKDFIIMPTTGFDNQDFYNELLQNGINIVFVDRIIPSVFSNYVTSNNFSGGYLAAAELLDLGCSKFFLCSDVLASDTNTITERFEGFQFCVKEKSPLSSIEQITVTQDTLSSFIHTLEKSKDEPIGIFCFNDILALQIENAMMSLNFYHPIVGFDNVFPNMPFSGITTIEQFPHKIGYLAAQVLHEHHLNPGGPLSQYRFPVQLIKRSSTDANFLKQQAEKTR